MVKDVKYGPVDPWHTYKSYRAFFRLKVSRPTPLPPSTTQVVDIEVYDLTTSVSYKTTLTSADFVADNTYYLFSIDFNSGITCSPSQPPTPSQTDIENTQDVMPVDGANTTTYCYPHSFDLRVKWYGLIQVSLDDIRVDGTTLGNPNSSTLFSGGYDNTIKTNAKKFNQYSALARYYLKDEPYFNQFRSFDYVNKKLKDAATENNVDYSHGKSLGHTAMVESFNLPGTSDPYIRSTQEATPNELGSDIYRLYQGDPLPGDMNYVPVVQSEFQSELDKFKYARQNSIYSQSGTWWYYPNIGRWPGGFREPHLSEIYAQVYLALAYGAKGLMYFHYWTVNDGTSNFPIGLIDPATLDPINSSSQYSIYQEDKWNGIKGLNQKLTGSFGSTLMNLTWQKAFSIHQGQPTNSFITSVTTSDAASETYVELAFFKDASNKDYVMVVNRRSGPGETRNISLVFNDASVSNWEITDVNTGMVWILNNGNTFTDVTFSAGEGRLYKVESHSGWTGTKILPVGAQVLSGATLKILSGAIIKTAPMCSLTVNGKLVANGTSSQRVTFTSTNATPLPGDWEGILCSGGGPDTLTYCDIFYAAAGLKLTNTIGTSYMKNDTIKYNSYPDFGVRVSNTSAAFKQLLMYKCGIMNNDGPGMIVNNAKVSITYSRIANNGLQAITRGLLVANAAKVFLDSSRIQGNNGSGIEVSSLNSRVSLSANEIKPGYNTVEQHGVYEIYVRNRATAVLGAGSPGQMYAGKNNVFNNYSYSCRLINNEANEDFVLARHTYWGASYASGDFCGYVDYLYPLGDSIPTPAQTVFAYVPDDEGSPSGGTTSPQSLGTVGVLAWLSDLKDSVLSGGPSSVDALCKLALYVGPGGEYPNALRTSWDTFLANVETSSSLKSLRSVATSYRVQALLDRAEYAAAINLADDILKRDDIDDDMWYFCQARKVFSYVGIEDMLSAQSVFDGMKDRAEEIDKEATDAMKDYLSTVSRSGQPSTGMVKYAEKVDTKPRSYQLDQNYPNPFNPVTTITYALPELSHVILKVYNVIGQEVKTLVDRVEEAGFKSASFDAGSLSSGVYFYRLEANALSQRQAVTFTNIRKMLLIK